MLVLEFKIWVDFGKEREKLWLSDGGIGRVFFFEFRIVKYF